MGIRHCVRHGIDVAALATGTLSRMQRSASSGMTALMYHRVLPDSACGSYPLANLAVAESHFAGQVAWLARNATVLTVRDALRDPTGGNGHKPVVCLTFDDGYADNAEIAAPILEAHGLRASFFVTTGFVEGGGLTWFDRAALHWTRDPERCRSAVRELASAERSDVFPAEIGAWMTLMKRTDAARRSAILDALDAEDDLSSAAAPFRAMDVAQVKALHLRGHEIGNHTRTHPMLPQLTRAELADEIVGGRETLRRWTGDDVPGFCYPNGSYTDEVVDAVKRAGHEYALTTQTGVNHRKSDTFLLRRRMIHPSGSTGPLGNASLLSFRAETFGLHDRLRGRASTRDYA